MSEVSAKDWADYYRRALETVQIELSKPLKEGENFTSRKAYILGYIEGALKMVEKEIKPK
jgi:hypothetical protein